eukprot:gene636-441_t
MANLLKAVNTLASGATVYQERRNHFDSLQEEESMHRHTMSEMQDQFNKELQEARRIYLLSMYADMETYFQELNENLISSSRDAERDMVDQRNQQFQTILISATIMLATLLNIMFQGDLPENIHWMFYAGARSNTSTSTVYPDPPSPLRPALVSVRRNIAMLKDDEVDQEWKRHEREVTEYLTHRSRLAERLEAMAVEQENQERMSFELFWAKYCRAMANSALILFYLGTICLLIGTMIFSWTLLVQEYSSVISAIASVATIGASLVICAGLAIYLRFFDSSIVVLNAQLAREQHQHAKKYWSRMWDTLRSSHLVFTTHVDVDSKEN